MADREVVRGTRPKVSQEECLQRICEFPRLEKQRPEKTGFELYAETGYESHWKRVTLEQIAEYLRRDPELVKAWELYGEAPVVPW